MSQLLFSKPLSSKRYLLFLFLLIAVALPSRNSFALPALFQDELVAPALNQPTSMAFLPDGRMLVTQKFGQVFILDPRQVSPSLTPYLTITDINTVGERGLLDIVLDPAFPSQPYIYVVYHRESDKRTFISRFTHQGNTASISSEFVVWKDPKVYSHKFHHGGGLSFGPDGHLYLTTGEQFKGLDAQDLTKAGGKIIRVARDGTIPADNPYVDGVGGNLDEIWASGLRNPWRARWDIPASGSIGPRLFIGEVGGNLANSNEDIHIGKKGANFGWPYCEGTSCSNSSQTFDAPLFTYEHLAKGASVIGGVVYHGSQFPSLYSDVYFYGDYSRWVAGRRGIIRYLTFDSNGGVSSDNAFLENAGLVVDVKEGRDGALYYLEIASSENFIANTGALNRVIYNDGNQAPQITSATANVTEGGSPLTVQFSGSATDAENDTLQYVWVFGDGSQVTGANISHTYTENGTYQATLQVSDDNKTTISNPPVTITVGAIPEVTITEPVDGSTFRAGDPINFSASATDDGVLTESSYKWTILYVHNEHTHPELGPITGSSGTLHTPNTGHSFYDETGFEISVEVTDQDGVSTTKHVRIFPEKVNVTFNSQPSGVSFFVDGSLIQAPLVYDTAIDFKHDIAAPQITCLNGNQKYKFVNWSNGQAASFNYTVPAVNETLTATYVADGVCDANTNLPPLAFSDEISMTNNASRIINVLANDTDPDSNLNKGSVAIVRQPEHGTVAVDGVTGSITYNHDGSTNTTDSFTYTVNDEQGVVSNEATVLIDITSTTGTNPDPDPGTGVSACGVGLELDGINDWVNIPNLTLAGDFTVEAWVKLAPGIDNKDALFGQEGGGPDINFHDGKMRLYAYGDRVAANTALLPDTWGHVAITRSNGDLKLYINGVQDATGHRWTGALSLKALGRGNRGYFKGMLDEVRVWNVARTDAEMSAGYNSSVAPDTAGLIGYWNFNGTEQSLADSSSSQNHASLGVSTVVGADDPVRLDSTAPFTESCDGNIDGGGGDTNVAPIANNDTVGPVQAGGVISFTVTGNDSDNDGSLDLGSVSIVSPPNDGIVIVNASGTINYTNTGSSATTDTLTYTVKDNDGAVSNIATVSISVTAPDVTPVNVTPVTLGDSATVQSGESATISVLSNDTDSDGTLNKSSLTIVSGASNGVVNIDNGTGKITYTHNGSATTSDSFTYTVADNKGAVSNVATVSLTITSAVSSCGKGMQLDGVNDWLDIPDFTFANDFTVEGWVNLASGIDNKDALFGQEGGGPDINFHAGKVRLYAYGDRVAAKTALLPNTWGHIAITRSNGNLKLYINGVEDATGRWTGALSIKAIGRGNRGYLKGMLDEIRIWNVARTSTEVSSSYNTSVAPNSLGLIGYWNFNGVGQTISDMSSQANHGSLGRAIAIGADDPTRLDSTAPFTENCEDGSTGGGSTNIAPVANDDAVGPVQAGSSISFSVTGNDLDADSNLNPASVSIESMPSSGTASVDSTGKINYISTGSSALTDSLAYSVKDTEGATSNIATVSITVTAPDVVPANVAPVAQADTATAQSGGSVQIPILANDTDSDGSLDKESIFIVSGASNGNVEIDSITGQVTYTHDGSSMVSDSFVYTVTDNQGLASNEATVSLTINNTVSSSSCGKGVELDGINDWVNIPDVTLANDFTVEGWVKLAPGIDNKDALFGQEGGGPDINFYAGKVRLYAYGDRVAANTAVAPNTWSHIAITRSNGDLTIYINGVQDATGRWTGALSVKAIGRGNRGYLKGMIDEVRIWNVARTGSEITTSYNTNVAVNTAGLIGSWSFNGIDQVVTDASSQVSHASLGKNTTVGTDDPIRASSTAPIVESCN